MDTNSWRVEEIGIYQRLLMSEWVNGSLPKNEDRLARIAGCSLKKFQKGWTIIKIKFHLNGNDLYINDKLESIRINQVKYKELQSEKGKISAEKRRIQQPTVVEPNLQPEVNSSSSSSIIKNNIGLIETNQNPTPVKRWYKNEQGNYVCYQCTKSFMAYQKLQDHLVTHKGA